MSAISAKMSANYDELYSLIRVIPGTYTDAQCVARFVEEMNNVAGIVGMEDSVFYEPAGYPDTRNTTTAYDLLKLGIYASGIRRINDAWGTREKDILVLGENERTIQLTGPSDATFEQSYNILGWKPGLSTVYGTNTWIMVVQSKASKKIYVVGEYDLDNDSSTRDYPEIKAVLDYVDGVGDEPTLSHGAICVCELPHETPSLFSKQDIPLLYAYNEDDEIVQASTTKVMTVLVASIYGLNEFERVQLKANDIKEGSGVSISEGDILTVRDLFLCGMLPSSNTAMYAIARVVGEKLLFMDNYPVA